MLLRKAFAPVALLAVVLLAACGSTSTASNTNTPSPSSSPSTQASPTQTTVDPCQVVTQAEASQLAGTTYGAGKEDTTSGGAKICWYGAQTLNVFQVLVATASSAAAAQAQWDQEKSQVQAQLEKASAVPGLTITINISDTSLSGADRAAVGTITETYNGHTISGSAIYLLKGPIFFAMVDLVVGHAAPTSAAMEAEAQIALRRLP
jgi:phage protein D